MTAVSVHDRAAILDVLARAAWALDEGRSDEWIAHFTADAVIEVRRRDGSVTRWSGQGGGLLGHLRAEAESVSVQDRQTWTSDAVIVGDGQRAHVMTTSLRVGSASGGLSNVILGDARVRDDMVRSRNGWRIRSRVIADLGAALGDPDRMDSVDLASLLDAVASPAGDESRRYAQDRIEIEALFADYAWALDTADLEGVLALFSKDAVMQDPFARFEGTGPDGVGRFFQGLFARPEFAGRVHWVSQLFLTPLDGGYQVDSYALVPAAFPTGAMNLHLMAFYRDIVVRERGRWCFRERLVGPRWDG